MKKINTSLSKFRKARHKRVLKRLKFGNNHLRLRVVKTNLHFYLQTINDSEQRTVLSSSSLQLDLKNGNMENALLVAKDLIKKLKDSKIDQLVLDRGPHKYCGKISAVADLIRGEGIKI